MINVCILYYYSLSVRVGQSTHKNDICFFFYNEHERMARVELDGLDDVARSVSRHSKFQVVA